MISNRYKTMRRKLHANHTNTNSLDKFSNQALKIFTLFEKG